MTQFIEVLQQFLNDSGHYLTGGTVLSYTQILSDDGFLFRVEISNDFLETGCDKADFNLIEILAWLYDRGEK